MYHEGKFKVVMQVEGIRLAFIKKMWEVRLELEGEITRVKQI